MGCLILQPKTIIEGYYKVVKKKASWIQLDLTLRCSINFWLLFYSSNDKLENYTYEANL